MCYRSLARRRRVVVSTTLTGNCNWIIFARGMIEIYTKYFHILLAFQLNWFAKCFNSSPGAWPTP